MHAAMGIEKLVFYREAVRLSLANSAHQGQRFDPRQKFFELVSNLA